MRLLCIRMNRHFFLPFGFFHWTCCALAAVLERAVPLAGTVVTVRSLDFLRLDAALPGFPACRAVLYRYCHLLHLDISAFCKPASGLLYVCTTTVTAFTWLHNVCFWFTVATRHRCWRRTLPGFFILYRNQRFLAVTS